MFGRIIIKRLLKRAAGFAAVAAAPCIPKSRAPRICIFTYHRVADINFVDPVADDWNVPPALFEKQIAALARFAEVVALPDVPSRMMAATTDSRPIVCLTFDDAFSNFFTNAFPVLQRYGVPATVSAVTSAIGEKRPMQFDYWSHRHAATTPADVWRPMSWEELEMCASSDLITIGAHSHRHWNGLECTPAQLREEAARSFAILSERLGDSFGKVYSYPYGSVRLGQVPLHYAEAVREAGFQLAVTTELGLANARSNRFLLPRVEAHGLDTPRMLLAKARGVLFPYFLTDRLRRAKRPFDPATKDVTLSPATR